jgi:hypothetical protein
MACVKCCCPFPVSDFHCLRCDRSRDQEEDQSLHGSEMGTWSLDP